MCVCEVYSVGCCNQEKEEDSVSGGNGNMHGSVCGSDAVLFSVLEERGGREGGFVQHVRSLI